MSKATKPSTRRAAVPATPASTAKLKGGVDQAGLPGDLRSLVQAARERIAAVANATYTQLCWQVGRRLLAENLQAGRAAYGKQILATVSQELTVEFGAGFSYTALTRMARFAEWMTDERILATLSQTLSWSHVVKLREGQISPDTVFRDPYLLDLLGHKCAYSERDLESAILREIEGVLLELGAGFTFVARQKRMTVGKDDFYLDCSDRRVIPMAARGRLRRGASL